ncbi:MAG: protein NO VEIN domain-containing protein [Promethearchaeota archaeon]
MKYIEVKSTTQPPTSQIQINISSNQLKVAKKIENYYIYIVFEVKNQKFGKYQILLGIKIHKSSFYPLIIKQL